jgi:hypothetical protein
MTVTVHSDDEFDLPSEPESEDLKVGVEQEEEGDENDDDEEDEEEHEPSTSVHVARYVAESDLDDFDEEDDALDSDEEEVCRSISLSLFSVWIR